MTDNVIILGAGFSYDAGIPLLSSFVDRMWKLSLKGTGKQSKGLLATNGLSDDDRDLFNEAMRIRFDLDGYHGRARFDDRNIEDLLSLMTFNSLAGTRKGKADLITMNRAIARTIELSCTLKHSTDHTSESWPTTSSSGHGIYKRFWTGLFNYISQGNPPPCILTFNYDLVLERSLLDLINAPSKSDSPPPHTDQVNIKYHHKFHPGASLRIEQRTILTTSIERRSRAEQVPLQDNRGISLDILKLHGSINIPSSKPARTGDISAALAEPLILPPVFDKRSGGGFSEVWKNAIKALQSSKRVVIVGYSLPASDIYMQYFLKAGLGPNQNIEKIVVFDPALYDPSARQKMVDRYSECFSEQLRNRIEFDPSRINAASKDWAEPGTTRHFVKAINEAAGLLFF